MIWKDATKVGFGIEGKFVVAWFCSIREHALSTKQDFISSVPENVCRYSISPTRGSITLPLTVGEEINIYEKLTENFKLSAINFLTGEEDRKKCPIDTIYIYGNPGIPKYNGKRYKTLEDVPVLNELSQENCDLSRLMK